MVRKSLLVLCVTSLILGAADPAAAGIDAALSIQDGRVSSFYLAIGDHYGSSEDNLIAIKKRGISDDDMAVVFFLAKRARVTPAAIIDLRLDGRTWMEITAHFHLTAEIFYVKIEKVSGPPYGKAHGHFKNRSRERWKTIKMSDTDILNFVNLRFLSDHFRLSPDEIVRMREQGQSFVAIHDRVKQAKAAKKAKDKKDKTKKDTKTKGKGKH